MPNQPKTPHRSVRVPDNLWELALKTAAEQDTTIAAEVNRFLTRWTRAHTRKTAN